MGLFSTSTITCNERPSVGRNFRDTISESASPINRFTEKTETRSFDEIFYEADIAIREASNSMNKLWYKSVLESDTMESAIINEANIFSKVIEVIKTIFDAIKRAITSMLRKARAFLQKIFKKKPKSDASDNKDSKNTSKDSKADIRNTDKEFTPTDKAEEIESKKADLEREKEELQAKLKDVKKNEETNKKEEPQKAEDSIHASNIDSSKLDSSDKNKHTDETDKSSISREELEKKIKETEDALKKVDDELKTAEKATSANPKSKVSSSSTSQVKSDNNTSSVNDDVLSLYNEYISDIEGNWERIDTSFVYRKRVKNGPKITPYVDLFNINNNDDEKIDMCDVFRQVFSSLSFMESENSYRSPLYIISDLLGGNDDDNKIKKRLDSFVYDNQFAIEDYRKVLKSSNNTISDNEKNAIVAGFVANVRFSLGLHPAYVEGSKLKYAAPAWTNLDNALKGGKIDASGTAETPVDISVSELDPGQTIYFLKKMRDMRKNNSGGFLKSVEDCLKSIDYAKNAFTKKASFIMNEINSRIKSFSKDSYQYYSSEFIPVIQKALCDSISSVASVVNQVYSTRVKIFTEAFSKGNAWFEACLKLCIAAELASKKK